MEEMTTPETHNWKYLCWISSNIIKTLYDQTLGMHKKNTIEDKIISQNSYFSIK